jgi:Subtilisin inhibitor-like
MRTALAVIALALSAGGAQAAGGTTALRIVVRTSPDATARVTALRCDPARGTVARPASACRRLLSGGRSLFAPTPRGVACTQIYGGPQAAVVTGTLAGGRIWATFHRRDGCEVARWNRVSFLLGV